MESYLIIVLVCAIVPTAIFLIFKGRPKIKGNISSNGDKIYHLPDDRLYCATKIDKDKGERYFWTETEAMENGFTRSKVR